METQPPLEITVRWTRTAARMGYCIAALGDNGELQPMAPDCGETLWPDETDFCIYPTKAQARFAANGYAARWRAQGLDVIYRDDLEN